MLFFRKFFRTFCVDSSSGKIWKQNIEWKVNEQNGPSLYTLMGGLILLERT